MTTEVQLDVEHEDGTRYTLVFPVSDWWFELMIEARQKNGNIVKRAELQTRSGAQLVNLHPNVQTTYVSGIRVSNPGKEGS